MKIVKQSFQIEDTVVGMVMLKKIERAGRNCYKSEDRITEESALAFIAKIMKLGHHSIIEHEKVTVRFVCDRGVSHELVRHRLCAFSQESTRYANYSKDRFGNEITVIEPPGLKEPSREIWHSSMAIAEESYMAMLKLGHSPQIARSVLPNSLKTEIVVTANLREWRHIFSLRTAKEAHPQMRELMCPLLAEFRKLIPIIFDDVGTTEL